MHMRFASAGILLCAASVATAACGGADGEGVFGFPPPPEGSTCQEAVEYLQENFGPPGELAEGVLFNPGPDFGLLADQGGPLDLVVEIENPQRREAFLRRRAQIENGLDDWLAPAGLGFQQFRILWMANPPLRERRTNSHIERDPETGRAISDRLTLEDQFSGSLCEVEKDR